MSDIGQLWDKKFSREGYFYGFEPNAFISCKTNLLAKGAEILCLGEMPLRRESLSLSPETARNRFPTTAVRYRPPGTLDLCRQAGGRRACECRHAVAGRCMARSIPRRNMA